MSFMHNSGMERSRIVSVGAWACLYAAFFAVAVIVRHHVATTGVAEIWGWDYRTFFEQIQDWNYISYFGFRHPGLGLILSPLVALEHIWSGAYLVVMPAVALLTAFFIYRLSGLAGLLVWLSFPVTWLMAAIPESFPVAQLALVGSMFLINGNLVSKQECRIRHEWGFLALSVLNGMITLTNGFKPILAYLVTCHNRRKMFLFAIYAIMALLSGIAFFYIRSIVCGRSFLSGIQMTLSWIPGKRDLLHELYGFFIKPIGFYQSLVVYPLAFYCLIGRRATVSDYKLQILSAFFFVDVLLHIIIGWGMSEPWVFAPHWVFALPLVIGTRLRFRGRS